MEAVQYSLCLGKQTIYIYTYIYIILYIYILYLYYVYIYYIYVDIYSIVLCGYLHAVIRFNVAVFIANPSRNWTFLRFASVAEKERTQRNK